MKVNWSKVGIFAAGAAVGAVISAIVTRNVVDKTYRKVADDEIMKAWEESRERRKADKEAIKKLKETIDRQDKLIKAQSDQIKACGGTPVSEIADDSGDETEDDQRPSVYTGDGKGKTDRRELEKRLYTAYSRMYDRAEAEFPMEDGPSGEEEEEIVSKSGPKIITEDEFSCQCLDYSKDDLHYYLADGKMLDEEGELIDEPAYIVGLDWENAGQNAGDEVYVRNDKLCADYRIIFTAGAGENNMVVFDGERP